MRNETSIDIDAPPERVWSVMADVGRWPEWTASVSSAERLDDGDFRVGARAKLKQPRVPPVVWTVTALDAGRSFEWRNSSPGMRSVAGHRIEPTDGGSKVTLWVEQTGILATLFGGRIAKLTREYLQMEAEGLKRRSESAA